ncbi:MAG TPA: hypothetical protein VFG75_00300 [Gaiella sp.]|nr:hypothetical protein [Gaiella sp.]
MDQIVKRNFKTRIGGKNSVPVKTAATFDFEGVTDEQRIELEMRSIVIMRQADYRKNEHVPAEDTVKVAELLKRQPGGFKLTPESAVKFAMKDEQNYRATLAGLGVSKGEIEKLVKAKINAR